MENILKGLNPAQKAAVENFTGPSLIIAGAGSGKTRVLTSRIAWMIAHDVAPHNILALTFTNKAAAEMRQRIDGMAGSRSRHINMGTFHSVFLRILRSEAEKIGYPPAFTIYDTTDSLGLVKSICKDLSLGDNDKYKPRTVFAQISRLKNDLITPAVYGEDPVFVTDDNKRGRGQFIEIYKRYAAQCKANGAMDFDDLLLNMVVLFKNHPDVLAAYRNRFHYILVDEYQDTNHVQYLIVKALAMAHGNICVVGDDSQSIYSFRGARIENILNFKRDFPSAQVCKLERNYRSTQTIVNAANSVIARNTSSRDLKKECFSEGEQGAGIRLLHAYTDREEAELVVNEVRQLGRDGVLWEDIAVLYRINALSRGIEEALRRREIPYKIYRGHSFFDRKEIKDLLGYFRLIVNPRDDEAFKRIVNYPSRGIGDVTVGRIAAAARERGVSLWEAAAGFRDKKIAPFMELVGTLALERAGKSLYDFGREVAVRTGIIGSFKAQGDQEAFSALENIEELLNSMEIFREQAEADALEDGLDPQAAVSLEEWLGSVALMTDMDTDEPENRDRVTLMTVHSAKGLEFRHIFIVGLEEELFPSVKEGDRTELEEERRLFYVALTRAKEAAFLSFADTRFIHGNMAFRRPSRFVREIDEQYLDGPLPEGNRNAGSGFGYGTQKAVWEARRPGSSSRGEVTRGGWGESGKPVWEARKPAPPEKVAPVTPDARFRKIGTRNNSEGFTPRWKENPAEMSSSPEDASTAFGYDRRPVDEARISDARLPSVKTDGQKDDTTTRTSVQPDNRAKAHNSGVVSNPLAKANGNVFSSTSHRPPPKAVEASREGDNRIKSGARVFHAKFGKGTVEQVETMAGASSAADLKVAVTFDDTAVGRKILLSKFAKLEII